MLHCGAALLCAALLFLFVGVRAAVVGVRGPSQARFPNKQLLLLLMQSPVKWTV